MIINDAQNTKRADNGHWCFLSFITNKYMYISIHVFELLCKL